MRQLYAEGKAGRKELLAAESASYHAPGTCTFYGTANSNQMLMEIMGLHLPGAAFVNPNTPLRDALTRAAAQRVAEITALGNAFTPIGRVLDERAFVNGIVGLMATGGSTNHTLHLVRWPRRRHPAHLGRLRASVRGHPAARPHLPERARRREPVRGGWGDAVRDRAAARRGLGHADVLTVAGEGGLERYRERPRLEGGNIVWEPGVAASGDTSIVRPASEPFAPEGGLKLLNGNLGRGVIKISAVKPQHRLVEAGRDLLEPGGAPGGVQTSELDRDRSAVVRFQGPQANGMPELHKLTPQLGVLQDRASRSRWSLTGGCRARRARSRRRST